MYAWMNAGPDHQYMDRHACCHRGDEPQIYERLIANRPLTPTEATPTMPANDRELRTKSFRMARTYQVGNRLGSKSGEGSGCEKYRYIIGM